MTGATGVMFGVKVLSALRKLNLETHLIISHRAEAAIKYETDYPHLMCARARRPCLQQL